MRRAANRRYRRRSRYVVGSLMLIPLIDIFTNILLFLLVSYSVEGNIVNVDSRFKLPVSTSQATPKLKLNVQVTPDDIILDGERVAGVKEALSKQDISIPLLHDALNENTKKVEFIMKNNPDFKFSGEVMIQADKSIPFLLLEKVMYTCGQAGYGNISLAVMSRE